MVRVIPAKFSLKDDGNEGAYKMEGMGPLGAKAPPGMFRVMGEDNFPDGAWIVDDYASKKAAIVAATRELREYKKRVVKRRKLRGVKEKAYLRIAVFDSEGNKIHDISWS